MEIKSVIQMEVIKNDRTYIFHMPVSAPFGECYDAAFEVLGKVVEFAKQAAEAARPKEVSETPTSDGSVTASTPE